MRFEFAKCNVSGPPKRFVTTHQSAESAEVKIL